MLDLHEAARDLVDHHAAKTPPIETLTSQARVLRRRRRAARVAAALAAAALVTAFVYRFDGSSESVQVHVTGPPRTVASAPTTTVHYISAASAQVVTPAGWKRVNFDNASIAAPGDWTLLKGETQCPNPKYAVLIGADSQTGTGCGAQFPLGQPMVSYVRLLPLQGSPPTGTAVDINGHTGTEVSGPPQTETYYFSDLSLEMTVYGPDGAQVASTVGWSANYLLLHPTGPVSIPADWVTFGYEGVSVRVPPTWPQKTLGANDPIPGVCANPTFPAPVAERGTGGPTPCNGFQPYAPVTAIDGVWLTPYVSSPVRPFTPSSTNQVQSSPVPVYILPSNNNGQPIAQLVAIAPNGTMISINIGLGPTPTISQEIMASIR